jgi:hypothetical protein
MFSSQNSQVSSDANWIEECFQTYLYTGNGFTQTITNGIDLSTKGGMVWTKSRSVAKDNGMWDTVRGAGTGSGSPNNRTISSNGLNLSAFYATDYLSAFNSNGFNVTYGNATYSVANQSGTTYAGWTFRKQPKFFDIQTWTGNGVAGKQISHSLGSVPGCIMVLCTTANYSWFVYHRSANAGGATTSLMLNSTSAAADEGNAGIQNLTSTTFDLGGSGAYSTRLNDSGQTYIAYIFAHNAGGFGLTGTDNVISCGSYTGNGSATGPTVTLGYEPQWVLVKKSSALGDWVLFDNMRSGLMLAGNTFALFPNLSDAESSPNGANDINATATGFNLVSTSGSTNTSGATYIYIAIRRGPMKVPTDATKVFSPVARAGTSTATSVTTGFPVDFIMSKGRNPSVGLGENWGDFDRLRGLAVLSSNNFSAEFTYPTYQLGIADFANNTGMNLSASDNDYGYINKSGYNYGTYFMQRAPSFMDVVCYTGNGTIGRTVAHNLTVAPELIFVKRRDTGGYLWRVYTGATTALELNTNVAEVTDLYWNNTAATASVFSLYSYGQVNASGGAYVAYLFASCPGVSKIGRYTGTGATQTIACGFAGGARFVLIKRTDSTGEWYVWDTARGMVAGTDPKLALNLTSAESNANWVYTTTGGFQIVTSDANVNASGGSYIYLAIA